MRFFPPTFVNSTCGHDTGNQGCCCFLPRYSKILITRLCRIICGNGFCVPRKQKQPEKNSTQLLKNTFCSNLISCVLRPNTTVNGKHPIFQDTAGLYVCMKIQICKPRLLIHFVVKFPLTIHPVDRCLETQYYIYVYIENNLNCWLFLLIGPSESSSSIFIFPLTLSATAVSTFIIALAKAKFDLTLKVMYCTSTYV